LIDNPPMRTEDGVSTYLDITYPLECHISTRH
jgi:hypothetical protein